MRTGLLFVLSVVVWSLAACGGESTLNAPATPGDPPNGTVALGLADIPAPRAANEVASVVTVGAGTSSHLVQTNLHPVHDGVGVTQENPDWYFRFGARTPEQLAYKLFVIQHQTDAAVTMGQLSLDLAWQGSAPAGSDGFYVGVADFSTRSWRWLGPLTSAADIADYAPYELLGDPAMNNRLQIVLVNYAPVAVKVKTISFTTVDPAETTGDETLFFVRNDGGAFSLHSAVSGDLSAVTPLIDFGAAEIAGLQLRDTGGERHLVFNRRQPGGLWEVWQSNLDGSGAEVRYSDAGSNVRYAGYDSAKAREFTIVDGGEFGVIRRHELALGAIDLERELPGAILDTPRWYMEGSPAEISLIGNGLDEFGQPMAICYAFYDYGDMTDYESYRELLFTSFVGITSKDPQYFIWGYNQDPSSNSMTLFSGRAQDEEHFAIRLNIFCNPPDINNEVVVADPAADLEFPQISPDHKLLAFLRREPGAETGQLFVQSAFLRELDSTAVIAEDVAGPAVWFDPTPLAAAVN